MGRLFILLLCIVLSSAVSAGSLRCGGKLVKAGESSNALLRKCGSPVRKFSAREVISEHGKKREVGVQNWVYQRRGKNDMVVSVRSGTVVRIQVDRS